MTDLDDAREAFKAHRLKSRAEKKWPQTERTAFFAGFLAGRAPPPSTHVRAPYDLRLKIAKALDQIVCDDSTPEQVDKFIETFREFGLTISAACARGVRHDHWRVVVETSGEHIVSIEPEMLCGREISEADEDAIRTAAHHLLAFIGDPSPQPRAEGNS